MDKKVIIELTRDELATIMTALLMELERDYSPEIKADLAAAALAISVIKIK